MKMMRLLFVMLLISMSAFTQKEDSLALLKDSVLNRMIKDEGSYHLFNVLGHCRCMDTEIGTLVAKESQAQFPKTFSQMYNQFYPLARFVSKDSIVVYLDIYIHLMKNELTKKLRKKDEKFKLENSVFFSCSQLFEKSYEGFRIYVKLVSDLENYNKYVLQNRRYFEMYLLNKIYTY